MFKATPKVEKLVKQVTAFDTYAELHAKLCNGYVPTIKHKELCKVLRKMGWKVFDGVKVA